MCTWLTIRRRKEKEEGKLGGKRGDTTGRKTEASFENWCINGRILSEKLQEFASVLHRNDAFCDWGESYALLGGNST